MTVQEIIDNLDRTIEGKEDLHRTMIDSGTVAGVTMARWVKVNLDELKRIREDLLKVKA
jgi:hypothetical protein